MVIAVMLVVAGAMRMVMAFQMRGHKGWGWVVFSGVLSIALGVMIYMEWPASGLWVIGMFVAIELISQGVSSITIALAAKAVAKNLSSQTGTPPNGAVPV